MFKKLDLLLFRGTTFGPVVIIHTDSGGAPVNVNGWSASAEVRDGVGGELILNLKPTTTDGGAEGKISIPEILVNETEGLPPGEYKWDLILKNSDGKRLPPIRGGRFTIRETITGPEIPT